MKKMIFVFVALCALCAVVPAAQAQTNTLYTATISTFAITDAGKHADISQAAVKVKGITVTNTAATAQTITVYQNANDTNTITAVAVFAVPATIGTYEFLPFKNVSTTFTNADLVNIPYIGVRTSVTSSAASVNIEYVQ